LSGKVEGTRARVRAFDDVTLTYALLMSQKFVEHGEASRFLCQVQTTMIAEVLTRFVPGPVANPAMDLFFAEEGPSADEWQAFLAEHQELGEGGEA
jgi:hypothetical protein